jgi:hypothetical protein
MPRHRSASSSGGGAAVVVAAECSHQRFVGLASSEPSRPPRDATRHDEAHASSIPPTVPAGSCRHPDVPQRTSAYLPPCRRHHDPLGACSWKGGSTEIFVVAAVGACCCCRRGPDEKEEPAGAVEGKKERRCCCCCCHRRLQRRKSGGGGNDGSAGNARGSNSTDDDDDDDGTQQRSSVTQRQEQSLEDRRRRLAYIRRSDRGGNKLGRTGISISRYRESSVVIGGRPTDRLVRSPTKMKERTSKRKKILLGAGFARVQTPCTRAKNCTGRKWRPAGRV